MANSNWDTVNAGEYKCKTCGVVKDMNFPNKKCNKCVQNIVRWGDTGGKRIDLVHIHYLSMTLLSRYTPTMKTQTKVEYVSKYLIAESTSAGMKEYSTITVTKKIMLAIYFAMYKPTFVLAGEQLLCYITYLLTLDGYRTFRDAPLARRRAVKAVVKQHLLSTLLEELTRLKKFIDKNEVEFPYRYDGRFKPKHNDYVSLEEATGVGKGGFWTVQEDSDALVWIEE